MLTYPNFGYLISLTAVQASLTKALRVGAQSAKDLKYILEDDFCPTDDLEQLASDVETFLEATNGWKYTIPVQAAFVANGDEQAPELDEDVYFVIDEDSLFERKELPAMKALRKMSLTPAGKSWTTFG
jgi:hypothetical protein